MTLKSGPNLGLLIDGALGEPHYGELLRQWRGLDALVQPTVRSATTTAPPGSPADGDCYIVPAAATGAWAGKTNQIARWTTALTPAAWEFYVPKSGWRARIVTPPAAQFFDGTSWAVEASGGGGGDMFADLVNDEISISGDVALTASPFRRMYVCSGTTADYTVVLPPVAGNAKKIISFRMAPSLTKLVTIKGNAAELIDGVNTRVMWANEVAILMCDGTGWTKVGGKPIPMSCALRASVTKPMPSATETKLSLGTVLSDDGGLGDVANNRVVLRRTSKYDVTGQGYFDPGGVAKRAITILYLNGSAFVSAEGNTQAAPSFASPTVVAARVFAAGSILELYGYQDSGATGNAISGVNAASVLRVTEVPSW